MEVIKDLYNKAYVFFTTTFDHEIGTKEKLIDNKVQLFFKENHSKMNSPERRLDMKVKIIREYYNLNNISDLEERLTNAAERIQQKLGLKLTLLENIALIPNTIIVKQPDQDFQSKRTAYLEKVKKSTNPEDTKLKEYLENSEVKKLANEIESDMKKNISLKDLAILMAKYRKNILTIFSNMGEKAIGADEITEVYLAILLLQKSDEFPSALNSLNEYINDCNTFTRMDLAFVSAAISRPMLGIMLIKGEQ